MDASEIEKSRKTLNIEVLYQIEWNKGPFVFDGKLNQVIDSLIQIKESIPPEYRDSAECEIRSTSSGYDSYCTIIEVTYGRPETDEQVIARVQQEQQAAEQAVKAKEATERALLAQLSAKYGT